MRLYVRNWRCVEEACLDLARVNILAGKNSSGKSSLAYAAYFLSKLAEWGDPDALARQLFASGLEGVVRRSDSAPHYPLVLEAGEARFEARSAKEFTVSGPSPWGESFLLPSGRVAALKYSQLLSDFLSRSLEAKPGAQLLLALAGALGELAKSLTAPPLLLFLNDWVRLHVGKSLVERREVGDTGIALLRASTLLSLLEFRYVDPFMHLELPLHEAPDGFVDSLILMQVIDKAPRGSLIVIEEPESFKNALLLIKLIKDILLRAVKRGLTVVMTTHSDLVIRAVAKAVEEEMARPDNVAIYYLERSEERPWTAVKRIAVYEDGTLEEYPHADEVIVALF